MALTAAPLNIDSRAMGQGGNRGAVRSHCNSPGAR